MTDKHSHCSIYCAMTRVVWHKFSGVFRISVRRRRGAVGVDGVGCGGGIWVHPQKKIIFVPKLITLGG